MENEIYLIKDKMPEIGKNIIGYDENGKAYYCFMPKIGEGWRCSVTGFEIMINVVKWKYDFKF